MAVLRFLAPSVALPGAEVRAAAAVGLDTCCPRGFSRVRQGMARPFLPRHRAPGKAGDFPKRFVVRGFPSWLLERAEVSVETVKGWAAHSSPAPFLPPQRGGTGDSRTCAGTRWGSREGGRAGAQWKDCPGHVQEGIGHQRFPVALREPSWGVSICLSLLGAHSVQNPASPRAGH